MKILGIITLIGIALLIAVAVSRGFDINYFVRHADANFLRMVEIFGGLIIIYPVINLIMRSKIKLGFWHVLGVPIVVIYTFLTMHILAILLGDFSYIKIEHVGYYMQTISSIFVILVLRITHGTNNALEEQS